MTEFLMTFLLNAFWQTALVILAAIIGTRLLRDAGSRSKHIVWVAALFLSLTLPLLTATWFNVPEMTGRAETTVVSQVHFEEVGRIDFEASLSEAPVASVFPTTVPISIGLAFGILALYGLFVIYRMGVLVNALLRTSAIRRRASANGSSGNILAAFDQCRGALGNRDIAVLFSDEVSVPVTVGWLRPAIILPETFLRETDPNVLTTALGHEMVHVARRDFGINLFFEIVSLPISFHPAVAYAKRRIAQMRELCCDEVVASRLMNAEIYARSLLNIAGSATPANRLSPMITVGITDNKNLEVRIMSLLKRSEMSLFKKSLLALAALAVLTVPLVVAAYLSPGVTITSAKQPEAQPTVPIEAENERNYETQRTELEKKLDEIKTALADPNMPDQQRAALKIKVVGIESQIREIDRLSSVGPIQGLERKLEWLKAAQQDPKMNDVDRAKLMRDIENLERELAERKISETDQGARVERLKRQLIEVGAGLQDPNLPQEKRAIFADIEKKIRHELEESGNVAYSEDREKEERAFRERVDELAFRERVEKEKLARSASINGEQAIEIALAAHPGKLIEKGIGRNNDEVVYRFLIRVEPETPERKAVFVVVSGVDGRIINTENVFVEETIKGGVKERNLIIKKKP